MEELKNQYKKWFDLEENTDFSVPFINLKNYIHLHCYSLENLSFPFTALEHEKQRAQSEEHGGSAVASCFLTKEPLVNFWYVRRPWLFFHS